MIRKLLLGSVAAGGLLAAVLPASAADLAVQPAPAPVIAPVPVPVFTWTGWYIGGNAGAAWRTRDVVISGPGAFPDFITFGDDGFGCGAFSCDTGRRAVFTGGGQLGFNVQTGIWVWGAEGDINFIDRHRNRFLGSNTFTVGPNTAGVAPGTYTVTGFTNNTDEGNWFATVRGRLGFAVDRWFVYGTGGAAFHDPGNETVVTVTGPTGATTTFFPSAGRHVGWAAGVGGEFAVTDNVTIGAEWLHLDFGRSDLVDPVASTINGVQTRVGLRQDVDVVRARLNFKFGSLFGGAFGGL